MKSPNKEAERSKIIDQISGHQVPSSFIYDDKYKHIICTVGEIKKGVVTNYYIFNKAMLRALSISKLSKILERLGG